MDLEESNKKLIVIAITIVVAILLVFILRYMFPVVQEIENSDDPKLDGVFAENLMEDFEEENSQLAGDLPESFIEGKLEFSLDLFERLLEDENPVYSPIPVYLALGLLANGADKEAREEIFLAINEDDTKGEELNRYYRDLIGEISEVEGDTSFNISNSIWYDRDFKAKDDFLQKNKNYYGAGAYKIDFENKEAPKLINQWVRDATNSKINKMLDQIDEKTVMYLFSTIYFDAKWETPFPKDKSFRGDFFLENDSLEVEKMSNTFEVKSIINEEESLIVLPYKDSRYSFMALMPREGIDIRDYVKGLDMEEIGKRINSIEKERLNIILPKFEVSFENRLDNDLKDMGIERIFDPQVNSLEKMGESSGNIYLSKMIQKTYIKVDEEGTEAASVVEAQIDVTSLSPTIDFNRPFVYSILDKDTGLAVFLGIMDNPSKMAEE